MWGSAKLKQTRSLRFRLTVAYAAFFALLLIVLGLLFRETLSNVFHSQIRSIVEDEMTTLMGYLRFEDGQPIWYYDENDPEEASVVERLRRILLLTDANGNRLEVSKTYLVLGIEEGDELRAIARSGKPVWKVRSNDLGQSYLVRLGIVKDSGNTYVVGLGRPLAESQRVVKQFTWNYFALLPLAMMGIGLLGWLLSGSALEPVNHLARTAQRVSSSSLALRIPSRGAGDELDNLIETFNKMMERLERSFQQTRQFSTDVSHELRTPLTTIRGQLEVALMTATTQEQYRDAIVTGLQEVERLSQVVRALLHLAQAESGQLELQKSDTDLAAMVRDLVDQFEIPAEESEIRLIAIVPPECMANIDRIQIGRLLTNLLSNALKFTPVGGEIRVILEKLPDEIKLEVADTGAGIDQEHLPHIFDRFYRVPSSGMTHQKGLGLGLSFVAWIVRAHKGRIDVASQPGQGTRFTVRLPSSAAAPDEELQKAMETVR